MHKERTFSIVDVFTDQKYAGNQLAVFRDAGSIPDREMQQIAREINFSETTFILSDDQKDGGYDVRIFTPGAEVPFAGHPTLGSAYVIQRDIIREPVDTVVLNLKVGQIPVRFTYANGDPDFLWMETKPAQFGSRFDVEPIADALSIRPSDIDERFPIQEVSTGLPFIITPLKTLNAVKNARVVRDVFFDMIENTEAKAILIFCPETIRDENQLHARVFVDYYGIPEDPATGSANSCLAGYLVKYGYFGENRIDVRVEQGYAIGRPSLLLLRAEDTAGELKIQVGGQVAMVARGKFV